uniref:Protein kinase domain-containing protein n=1 Tax=Alexandrium monilatum TaxID=311494 RepID=A0A7S4SUZ1_9DINO
MNSISTVQRWWRSHIKQAPLDWVLALNRKPLVIAFLTATFIGGSIAFTFRMDARTQDLSYIMIMIVGVSLVVALVIAKCSLPHAAEMALIISGFLTVAALQFATVVLSEDVAFRLRSHATAMSVWKPIPSIFGFPVFPSFIFIGGTVVLDNLSLYLTKLTQGDPFEMRITGTSLVYALGWMGVAVMQTGRLCGIFEFQQALAGEKALMESIIAMMCNSIVWLSEDGGMVVRTDQRFAMLIGRDVTGEQVSGSFPEDERGRIQDCLQRAKEAPALLPTTLVSAAGARIPVEMFVVGNRNVSKAEGSEGHTPAFLLGIRLASTQQGTEELTGVDIREEHMTLLAENRDKRAQAELAEDLQSAGLSLPETTSTGRMWKNVDVDRWLQGTPEERAVELRSSLQKVGALGQAEHWLIDQSELEIEPKQVLGAGSFGYVVGGWFHGSPIAIKVAKHQKDASVSHLVSIANEIRILRHVRHPCIVLFHGACVEPTGGEVLLVLERIRGPDLYDYVTKHSADAEIYKRFQLMLDVACALRYLHSQIPQIVHGDLKGSNVLVEATIPRAKLVDFGLSRLLTKEAKPLGGSLAWMAPELIIPPRSKPQAGADVFSFGRLAYLIIACRKPLHGINRKVVIDMAKRGVMHKLLWNEDKPLHKECKKMCQEMLSFEPQDRPSMAQVHIEASSWTLPNMAKHMPSLALVKTEEGSEARTRDDTADDGSNLREMLNSVRSEQPVLALPGKRATQDAVKRILAVNATLQWNILLPPGCCCTYHAAMTELLRIADELNCSGCNNIYAPFQNFQCSSCGVLDVEAQDCCPVCNKSASRVGSETLGSIQEEEEPDGVAAQRSTVCSL